MKRVGTVLGAVAAAGSGLFLARYAWGYRAALGPLAATPRALAAAAAALLLYLAILLSGATAWRILLRGLGSPLPWPVAVRIFLVSQLGKYLPGNVGHYVGRLALARRHGVAASTAAASLILEIAATLIAGLAVACAGWFAAGIGPQLPGLGRVAVAGAGALALLLIVPRALELARRRRWLTGLDPLGSLPARVDWAKSLACLGLNFLLFGSAASLLGSGLAPMTPVAWSSYVGLFAAAWVVGFVTPGAPAGLGVRELLLVAGLQPLAGPAVALALALTFRVVTTLGDALGGLIGLLVARNGAPGGTA